MNERANKRGIGPLGAAFAGLVIGVLGTAVIALSDEPTRKRAAKKAKQLRDNLKQWSDSKIRDWNNSLEDLNEEFVEKTKSNEEEQAVEEKALRN